MTSIRTALATPKNFIYFIIFSPRPVLERIFTLHRLELDNLSFTECLLGKAGDVLPNLFGSL
jgi:hypothetical protein